MRAYRFDHLDGLDGLRQREEADPKPQRGEVLVRVRAVSLNFRDLAMPRGRYPRPCLPGLIPISDAAGEVIEVGKGVEDFKVGDRVAYAAMPGSYSEERLIDAKYLVKLPKYISYEMGAAMMLKGLTAQYLLRRTFKVKAGDTAVSYTHLTLPTKRIV